jgi:hypothetical protein
VLTQAQIIELIQGSYATGLTFSIADTGSVTISNHTRIYPDKSRQRDRDRRDATRRVWRGCRRRIYIFYDDMARAGGAVTYQHLKIPSSGGDASSAYASPTHPYRHTVCAGVVPALGGTTGGGSDSGSGGGGGGPCVTTDTLIDMAEGGPKPAGEIVRYMQIRTRPENADGVVADSTGTYHVSAVEIVPDQPVYLVEVGGKTVRATGDHRIWIDGQWKTAAELGTADGNADVVKMTVADAQTYVSNGLVSHNLKPIE